MFSLAIKQLRIVARPLQSNARFISSSNQLQKIFKVQDGNDFENNVRLSKEPVVVDFFATWCNPCKVLMPRIETVIQENEGKIHLAKVDIDELSEIADDFEISSVPVLLVIKDGKVQKKMVGLQDLDKIRTWVQSALK